MHKLAFGWGQKLGRSVALPRHTTILLPHSDEEQPYGLFLHTSLDFMQCGHTTLGSRLSPSGGWGLAKPGLPRLPSPSRETYSSFAQSEL